MSGANADHEFTLGAAWKIKLDPARALPREAGQAICSAWDGGRREGRRAKRLRLRD
jgi:hypothetical protein